MIKIQRMYLHQGHLGCMFELKFAILFFERPQFRPLRRLEVNGLKHSKGRLLILHDWILFQNKVFSSPPISKMQLLTLSIISKTLVIKFHEWNLLYSSWQFDHFKIIQCLRISFHQSIVSVIFANQFKFLIKTVGSVITLNSWSFFLLLTLLWEALVFSLFLTLWMLPH